MEDPKLELKVTMLNINAGHNEKLMEECKTLRDYSLYVDKVRTYAKEMELSRAVERAVNECIQDDILKEFLLEQKAEAIKVTIYEFDQARHDRTLREEGREEGKARGKAESLFLILSQYGTVPDDLREAVMGEKDITRLDEWLRKALQLQSVEAFRKEFN